jgi:hypothetical protein
MNGFYPRRYSGDEVQQYGAQENGSHIMDMAGGGITSLPGAQTLDDIVNQNAKDMRRRSMPVPFQNPTSDMDESMRRASMVDMMDFSGASPDMANFHFDTSAFDANMVDMSSHTNDPSREKGSSNVNNLSVNTRFPSHSGAFGSLSQQASGFDSALSGQHPLEMDLSSPYLTSAFPSAVSMGNDMNMMSTDMPSTNIFNTAQFNSPMANSPLHTTYGASMLGTTLQDPGGGPPPGRNSRSLNPTSNTAPDVRHTSTRTNSNDNTSQTTSGPGSATTQSTSIALSNGAAFSPKKITANLARPPEMINGNPLPWTAPPG